jgi:hypothetical protein
MLAIFAICFFAYRRNTRVKDFGSTTSKPRSSWVPFSKRSCSTNTRVVTSTKDTSTVGLPELRSNGWTGLRSRGVRDFWTKIKLLSQLRHVNLVPLIRYCNDQGEMILVYDFMESGTLRDHLYNTKNPPRVWCCLRVQCLSDCYTLFYWTLCVSSDRCAVMGPSFTECKVQRIRNISCLLELRFQLPDDLVMDLYPKC